MTHRSPPPAIAVIGLACRYPDAATPRQLWENILGRRRQFRRIPDCRLPLADYYDADKKVPDKTYGRQAAVIDGFDFDWAARRIPFSTVRTTDIVHWLALETSLAAVADAGYTRETLPGARTGVIIGNTLTGEQTRANTMRLRWPFVRRALHSAARTQGMDDRQIDLLSRTLKDRYTAVFPPVDEDTLAGGLSNTIAGRICNHLNLMGGGFTVDGACSSSLLAVAHAASRMVEQDLDMAIVGGVDISLDPFELIGFAKTGALTDGDMTVYDRGGKGFIPGEGCGFMVIKPLAAARRDGDRVYAVIHGWGISSDGGGSGITAPSVSGQALALERAYQHAPHGIKDLDFIEGHGTGTTVGDRTELEAIARVIGRIPVPRGQLRPCGITSLKSILGHTKAASGIGGLIKAVMAVNRRVVPPTAACTEPHQAFDAAARRLYPVRLGRQEPADRQLKAGVSSMGFGGINCHITLVSGDKPDDILEPVLDEGALLAHAQESELLVLGAGGREALLKKIADLIKTADGISMAELADFSADLNRQEPSDVSYRAAIVAGNPDELTARLLQLEASLRRHDTDPGSGPVIALGPDIWLGRGEAKSRVGFLFPGQGSQQLNMARVLVQRFPWARSLLEQADQITRDLTGIPVSRLIFRDADRAPGPEERDRWLNVLSRTENAQPAICLASMLWFTFFTRLGIRPEAVGGHSLGELTACFAAGVFDAATLLKFSARRGQAMSAQSGVQGAMVGLRCDESTALAMIPKAGGYLTVANLNSPRQTVLSGETEAVRAMMRIAQENGISARVLPVSGAFHSRLCDDAARQVDEMALLAKPMEKAACRIFSSVDGAMLESGQPLNKHFSRQIRSRVDFIQLARSMATSCDLIVELGPGRVLTGLAGDVLGEAGTACLPVEGTAGGASDLNRALGAMFAHGVKVHWEAFFENRLIRPFVPAARKSFVVNPCETLPHTDRQDPGADAMPADDIPTILAEAFAGVPEALVSRYLAARGAFLNRVVQADLSFWDPEALAMKPAAGGKGVPAAGDSAPVPVQTRLFRMVSDVTGFPLASLSRESRLLDDLNLDSIKAGDLIAQFARRCGVTFPDPALLANAALGELTEAAQRLRGDADIPADHPAVDHKELGRRLLARVSEITGFPTASIDLSMRLLDDLNLDSIKAGDLIAHLTTEAGVSGRVDVQSLANASLADVVDRIAAGMGTASAKPVDALVELMRQAGSLTGFPGESLDPDFQVDEDLHMGPDKLKTLVQRTATAMEIQAHVDMDPLLTRSLRQISVILNRMAAEQHGAGAGSTGAAPALAADQSTWVRNFSMDLVETPYPQFPDTWQLRSENDWQKSRVLILHSEDTADVAAVLGQQFFQRGAYTRVHAFEAEDAAENVRDPDFSHIIAILPRNDHRETDRSALLHRLIRMRASLTTVPPAASAPRRRTTVAWVQFGGGFFGRDGRFARLDRCGAVALGASLHLERADLRVRVVDFCPALSAETIAWETLAETITQDSFAAVGYDLDLTRRTLCPRLLQPFTFKKRDIQWSGDDVILVTGGARGITAACTLAVARETGVRLALVGRTPHPDQASPTAASLEIRTLLDKYAALGLTADYFPCDVSDCDALAKMLTAVSDRLGPVTGIIHGAGLNRPRLTGQVKPEQAFAETAPKVLGMLHLLDALASNPPKLIVGMGSIISITGMPGNGWYGFSNEVMDIALRGFSADHPQTRTATVAYSIWRDEGMGARMGSVDLLRGKGIDAIPTDEGVNRFLKVFTHDPGSSQVVVAARMGGMDTWNQALPDAPRGCRFLEHQTHLTPGVEAVFSTHLSLETDPYLIDHHFQGSYLFPTVFGLEAMAQAALYLSGQTQLSRVQIRNVRLLRPITVDPETGADITIRATLAEMQDDGESVVHAGIRKQGTGVQSDFFAATLVFGATDRAPMETVAHPNTPMPLVPQTDLYRPSLLFQGTRFQGIQTVWDIRETGEKTGTALFTACLTPAEQRSVKAFGAAFDEKNRSGLHLGDAFFTDTLLQSAALLVPQDTSLPVSIDRMDLFPEFFSASTPATVRVELVGQEDRDLVYRVAAVSDDGTTRAVLQGYRLRILKHHDAYPTVADLVFPEDRDGRLVHQAIEEACRHFSVRSPLLELACIPGIHDKNKPERREAERPMLERALSAAARRYDVSAPPLAVRWQENGKPTIADVAPSILDLSLAHEDRTCLCVCGPGPVGCDLAAITARDREGWNGLLGDHRSEVLDSLIDQGEALDSAGTRVWAAVETLAKAGGRADSSLTIMRKKDQAVLFAGSDGGGTSIRILTLAIRLTWGSPQILAVTVGEQAVQRVPAHLLTADYPGYEPLYETRPFEMIEGGPQGQLVFVQRLPVTFQPSANLSRTIYFSNFIKWMGNTREASAWPVLAEMSDQFASGRWGGVTNYGHLKILGEAGTSDRIEILMWVSDNSGPENSTMTLSYDFRKMVKGGGYQRLAFCRLQTTWVEILGPGVAKVAPYPAYYGQFIEDMCPQFDAPDTPEPLPESLGHLFDGEDDSVMYMAPSGPVVRPIVREQTFETTLSHANLVGNIYYANYYEWQGQIRDRFFFELIPDFFGGIGEKGELLALESRVDHLREAMPFDRVLLTLSVKELRACSVVFHVDYFRLEPDGSRVKIAYGMHRAVWTLRDERGRPLATRFPDRVRAAFDAAIGMAG
ncbi:SDR family NAD(P)-dependent oxidoreductase [uncultured Desulfosarcina sp.]|uniref:SDR family NAD(P)-dependent oxidoreductase n=1 Tax=uncultured Desulfosarcina sp. TaxID=218289 RepID=UPI0029C8BD5A|nr:SDR family NAD(P)-dependent oxidoreductase [uncultured Desulfosarcina sp.]